MDISFYLRAVQKVCSTPSPVGCFVHPIWRPWVQCHWSGSELIFWVLLETSKNHITVLGLNGRITKFRKL